MEIFQIYNIFLAQIHPWHHNVALLERVGSRVLFVDDVRGVREGQGQDHAADVRAALQQQHPGNPAPQAGGHAQSGQFLFHKIAESKIKLTPNSYFPELFCVRRLRHPVRALPSVAPHEAEAVRDVLRDR